MDFKSFYKPPFSTDGVFVWTADEEHMALMIEDENAKEPEALLQRVCDILNGEVKPNKPVNLVYEAPNILMNGKPFLTIRGWGDLTTSPDISGPDEAALIEDDFAEWVISKLQGQ